VDDKEQIPTLGARNWYEFLLKVVTDAMVSGYDDMEEDDRAELEGAIQSLRGGFALAGMSSDNGLVSIQQLMSASFLIGAHATMTTSHRKLFRKLLQSRPAALGGKKSGKKRQEKVAETWHPIALNLAKAFRGRHLGKSRMCVANYIVDHWNSKDITCPESRIYKAVCEWTRNGNLAPPQKS